MPKKTSSVLEKVSKFVKIPLSLGKLRKPITLSLLFFKKKSGKVKFYRHYNYGLVQGYQFLPSNSSPLVFPHRKHYYYLTKEGKNRNFRSILLMCMCLGNYGDRKKEEFYSSQSSLEIIRTPIRNGAYISGEEEEVEMLEISDDECGLLTVDERAERFIEKFYAQMRMQCQDSSNNELVLLGDK